MRRTTILSLFVIFMAAGFVFAQNAAKKPLDTCLSCHKDLGSPEAEKFQKDVHHGVGVSCADCHGGDRTAEDMDAAMDKVKGFRGVPKPSDIPKVCGKCHGASDSKFKTSFHLDNVVEAFESSVHGSAWKESGEGPQCISCHGIHNITKVKDPTSPVYPTQVVKTCSKCHSDPEYMKKFNPSLAVDQYEKYLTSIHGRRNSAGDPKTATCVSCHSNHLIYQVKDPRSPVSQTNIPATCAKCHSDVKYMANYHIPTTQFEDYKKSVHGVALLQKSDLSAPACNSCHGNHGAAPPGIASIAGLCGQCHSANAELFDKSIHKTFFDKQGLPGCVVCHSNHLIVPPSDVKIGFEKGSYCGNCHTQDDKAGPTVVKIRGVLDNLTVGQSDAAKMLAHAEQLGMDVAEAKYSLKDVNQSLIESRVKIHSLEVAPVLESAEPGLKIIEAAKKSAQDATHEYYFRRQGLSIASLIITVVVVLLYLKIRQIEQNQKKQS
jgi:predicted CXXCH cytochrome family protein